ncbi:hypothetical protein J5N97_027068 [Dioscorea zingiberensis]|uniref:Uncharacterized protein n=1 Tax=Dioscorea zingiberensis TaxID=325984 RepID=A0A9D5C3I1_9LILI|nr:hypothetical protein J5N97_027068 [Dioscorea zingiberensis]
MASRLLSRSKQQLYAGQVVFQQHHAIPLRFFAKEAAPPSMPPLKGDEMLKGIFYEAVREKAGLFSESQRVKYTIEQRTRDIPDARTYLLTLQEIRAKSGLTDDLGAEPMMMGALEKIEKD